MLWLLLVVMPLIDEMEFQPHGRSNQNTPGILLFEITTASVLAENLTAALVAVEVVLGVTLSDVVIVEAVVEVVVVAVMLSPLGSPHQRLSHSCHSLKISDQRIQSAQKACPHRRPDARCKHFDRAAMKC